MQVDVAQLRTRSQALAWDRISSKLCFTQAAPASSNLMSWKQSFPAQAFRSWSFGTRGSERKTCCPELHVVSVKRLLNGCWLFFQQIINAFVDDLFPAALSCFEPLA